MKYLKHPFAIAALVLVAMAVAAYFLQPTPPQIDDVWFINLDKDVKRLEFYMSHAHELPKPPTRWPGTNGRQEERETAREDGVCTSLSKSMDKEENKKSSKVLHNPGVIGCWLSHKRLLQHLATMPVGSHFGHLIMEDDVHLVDNFIQKWEEVRREVPSNWDIVYLGYGNIHGDKLSPHVVRWRTDKASANWGTFGYLVRHGALPHILKQLKYMNSPIDTQYYRMLDDLNVYMLDPALIYADEHMPSTILTL